MMNDDDDLFVEISGENKTLHYIPFIIIIIIITSSVYRQQQVSQSESVRIKKEFLSRIYLIIKTKEK
jgi:hypothetical protein